MKEDSSISLRAAVPSLEDGCAFARYLNQAAEGFFRFWIGKDGDEILAEAFQQSGHDFSFENVTFAVQGEEKIGMASGYTGEQHRQFSDLPLREASNGFSLRMTAVSILCAPLFRVLNTIPDSDFYLQAIAVDGQFRGQGVGSALLDAMQAKAVESGSERFTLDVVAANEGARKLYERLGMTIDFPWPKVRIVPGLKFYRMAKEI